MRKEKKMGDADVENEGSMYREDLKFDIYVPPVLIREKSPGGRSSMYWRKV